VNIESELVDVVGARRRSAGARIDELVLERLAIRVGP
jgi:hypothetical protein